MKILSNKFIKKFNGKIVNIHPSLLPKYKGLNTHRKVLENNEKFSGCTVHYVTAQLDSGKIILQKQVKITKTDTEKTLKRDKQVFLLLLTCQRKLVMTLIIFYLKVRLARSACRSVILATCKNYLKKFHWIK